MNRYGNRTTIKSGTVYYQWPAGPRPVDPATGQTYKVWTRLGKVGQDAQIFEALSRIHRTPRATNINLIIDGYLRSELHKKSPATQKSYLKRAETLRGVFGHMHPESLTAADVVNFVEARAQGTDKVLGAPATANHEKSVLKLAYQWALERGMVSRNVVADVTFTADTSTAARRIKGTNGKSRTDVTNPMLETFLAHAPAWLQCWALLAATTGARVSDVVTWTWDNVSETEIRWTIRKGGEEHAITITPQVRLVLDRCRKLDSKSRYVLVSARGTKCRDRTVNRAWEYLRAKTPAAFELGYWLPHDLRARAIADVTIAAGGDLGAGQRLVKHSRQGTTQRYIPRAVAVEPNVLPGNLLQ